MGIPSENDYPAEVGSMTSKHIVILGVGNILFSDEGIGIRVIEKLQEKFKFPENVSVEDGGTLGLALLGVISGADHLIIVDAIRNGGDVGSLYRLDRESLPKRIRAKNSLHQVDLLEALTMCEVLGRVPEIVILGVEPSDIETLSIELTPTIQAKVGALVQMVLEEVDALGVRYHEKEAMNHVRSHTCQDHPH